MNILPRQNEIYSEITSQHFFVALVYSVLLVGMAFPYGFPILTPIIIVYFAIYAGKNIFKNIIAIRIDTGTILFISCIAFFFWGVLNDQGVLYGLVKKDVKNIVFVVIFTCMVGTLNIENFRRSKALYHKIIVPATVLIAIISLSNHLLLITKGHVFYGDINFVKRSIGVSLSGSYNMFALSMFAGLYASYFAMRETDKTLFIVLYFCSIIILVLSIVFSGSRRALLILLLLAGIFIIKRITMIVRNRKWLLVRKKILLIALFLSVIVLFYGSKIGNLDTKIQNNLEIKQLKFRYSTLTSNGGGLLKAFSKRTVRWKYSWEIISGYSLFQLLFGDGFNYLITQGIKIKNRYGHESDPHNYLISAIHYSGVFGCLALLTLNLLAFFTLLGNRSAFGCEFIFLFITAFVFLIIGSNTFFSIRLLPVMVITILTVVGNSSLKPRHDVAH